MLQVILELFATLLLVLDSLFNACDFRTQRVIVCLDLIEFVRTIAVINTILLDGSINLLMLCVYGFKFDFQLTYRLGAGLDLAVQFLPLQRLQLPFQLTFFFFKITVFFR